MESYDTGFNFILSEYEKLFDSIRDVKNRIRIIYEKINCKLENSEEKEKQQISDHLDTMQLCYDDIKKKNKHVKIFLFEFNKGITATFN